MNFANADTLAPIMKMRRSETARAWGIVCSQHPIPNINEEQLDPNTTSLETFGRLEKRGCCDSLL
jgi:hypothetical protein